MTSYDEWSYSDLDPSSEFMREASSTAIHRQNVTPFCTFSQLFTKPCDIVSNSVSDPDWIQIQSGQWIRIQEDKNDPQK